MTTRRDFLKVLGIGTAVAVLPATAERGVHLSKIIKDVKKPWDKPVYPREVVAVEDVTCADPNLRFVTGHGSRLRPGDMILNRRTAEQILVTGVRHDEIVCLRGIQSAEYSVVKGDRFLLVGSAYEGVI